MKQIKTITIAVIMTLSALSSGCSMLKSSPENSVAKVNESVNTTEGRVIILPVILNKPGNFAGANSSFDSKVLDGFFLTSWSTKLEGEGAYPVPKTALNTIPGSWEAIEYIAAAIEGAADDDFIASPVLDKFFAGVNEKFGKCIIAMAFVNESEAEYDASKTLTYKAVLFDMESSKYKWVVDTKITSGVIPVPYQLAMQKAINGSWVAVLDANEGLAR